MKKYRVHCQIVYLCARVCLCARQWTKGVPPCNKSFDATPSVFTYSIAQHPTRQALHPNGALYEKPVNINVASKQHEEFRAALRRHGKDERGGARDHDVLILCTRQTKCRRTLLRQRDHVLMTHE